MFSAKVHRTIYIVLLALLGGTMVTSVWASNLVWVLMGANWLLEGRWREKWQIAKASRLLQAFVALYLLLLVGMLWTSNQPAGWSVLQVKLPLLCVPLVVLTTRPVTGTARRMTLFVYALAVTVVSLIGLVRWMTIPGLPYRDIVPYISHIRFALSCCMLIYLAFGEMLGKPWSGRGRQHVLAVVLTVWMLAFLLLIRSYTAFVVLPLVSLVMLLVYYRRWPLIALWVLLVGGAALVVGIEVHRYYHMVPMATEPLRPCTDNGRPYIHAQDGLIENGNYVNNYVCKQELRAEWNLRSRIDYDSLTENGYSVESTLIRYLNALGLPKDSTGVAALSDAQLESVERGVANPVYESRNPVRKMVYTLMLEREFYRHTRAVSGFTMLQRMEMWHASATVVRDNMWFGVGTGDAVDALQQWLVDNDSELVGRRMSSHNQYLGLLVALGIVGFALVMVAFGRACPALRRQSPLLVAWFLTIVISMFTEDTLDTLAGILFCTYFLAYRDNTCTNTTHCPTA